MIDQAPRATGALPPPRMEWQIGKSAASISFVRDAEHFLATMPIAKFSFDIEQQHEALRQYISLVRAGQVVPSDWLTVEQFLANPPQE